MFNTKSSDRSGAVQALRPRQRRGWRLAALTLLPAALLGGAAAPAQASEVVKLARLVITGTRAPQAGLQPPADPGPSAQAASAPAQSRPRPETDTLKLALRPRDLPRAL